MQHEAAAALDRAAAHHGAVANGVGQADDRIGIAKIEFVQDIGEAHILEFVVDHQAP